MMKRYFLFLIALCMAAATWAQGSDDVYFTPKKTVKKQVATETYYVGSNRDVDEYNRHGTLVSTIEALDNDDIVDLDAVQGTYPDSLYAGEDIYYDDLADDDYACTRDLCRWYGCWSPYYTGWWGWYDPWYWGWATPWYYSWYYPWHWGGWYYPSYRWGGHGGIGHHGWLLAGGRGRGYSNRGSARVGAGGLLSATGRRTTGNVYNSIAKRSAARNTYGRTTSRTSTSRTSTPVSSSRSYSSATRSGASSYGGTRSSGSFGGSRGGFGGGSHGGGGGHGGRR